MNEYTTRYRYLSIFNLDSIFQSISTWDFIRAKQVANKLLEIQTIVPIHLGAKVTSIKQSPPPYLPIPSRLDPSRSHWKSEESFLEGPRGCLHLFFRNPLAPRKKKLLAPPRNQWDTKTIASDLLNSTTP